MIAFLVPSPFEILDLTGPVSVFERATTNGERHYSVQVLSTRSSGTVETAGGMTIGNALKYSDYTGTIDTLYRDWRRRGRRSAVTGTGEMVARARSLRSAHRIDLYGGVSPCRCRAARWAPRCYALALVRYSPESL